MEEQRLKTWRLAETADPIRPAFAEWHARARARGMPLLIVRAWANLTDQLALWAIGRERRADGTWVVTDPARVRTRAQPGTSAHNVCTADGRPAALAIDVIPLDRDGRPLWALPGERPRDLEARWVTAFNRTEDEAWRELYDLAVACGLDPLGDPRGAYLPWDKGHVQAPDWRRRLAEWNLHLPRLDGTPSTV